MINTVEQAMKKLNRIKVGSLYYQDIPDSSWKSEFDYTWWMVLAECDLYRQGEKDDEEHLDTKSLKTAIKWLEDTRHLVVCEDLKQAKI